jgi:hypothetical protein
MEMDPEMVTDELSVADLIELHESLSVATSLDDAEHIDRLLDLFEDAAES